MFYLKSTFCIQMCYIHVYIGCVEQSVDSVVTQIRSRKYVEHVKRQIICCFTDMPVCENYNNLSHDARKPVFGVSEQVRHKLGCATTEDG